MQEYQEAWEAHAVEDRKEQAQDPKTEAKEAYPYRYRVMLVDDEEEVREGIREKMDWKAYGFDLVAEAANGQEAWESAKTLALDVVITDIRMPFMNGLDLCHNLRTMFPDISLVILTGYDDFEYAKRAIQENVMEYILKPVNSNEFTELMKKVRKRLDERLSKQYDIERLKRQYERSLPILREQLLSRLLDSSVEEAWVQEKIQEVCLEIEGEQWTVGFIRYHCGINTTYQRELLPHLIRQLAQKELPRYCPVICFLYQDYVAVLATLKSQRDILLLINGMKQICLSAERYLKLKLEVGIGAAYNQLSQLRQSAAEAKNALDYQTMVGEESVVYIGDIEPQKAECMELESYSFRDLLAAMRLEDSSNIEMKVRQFLSALRTQKKPVSHYRLAIMELATELMRAIKPYALDETDDFSGQLVELSLLRNLNTPRLFEDKLIELCIQISHAMAQKRNNTSKLVVQEAQKYIQQHFSNSELSLETLCSHLHLSTSHFSSLFKQETGGSFVNYLTEVRLDEAARLLDYTEMRVSEISQRVGYSDPTYFSHVFKKRYGISPMKYRYVKE